MKPKRDYAPKLVNQLLTISIKMEKNGKTQKTLEEI